MSELEIIIPNGCYCYNTGRICPFWELLDDEHGKCNLLNISDMNKSITLFDQVKECNVNDEWNIRN